MKSKYLRCANAIATALRLQVQLHAGDPIEAEAVGSAPGYDLAVIKLKRVPNDLRPISIGTSRAQRAARTAAVRSIRPDAFM
jgi:S1-C subfamily serine protease